MKNLDQKVLRKMRIIPDAYDEEPKLVEFGDRKKALVSLFTDNHITRYVHWLKCDCSEQCEEVVPIACSETNCPACEDGYPVEKVGLLPVFDVERDRLAVLLVSNPRAGSKSGTTTWQELLERVDETDDWETDEPIWIRLTHTRYGGFVDVYDVASVVLNEEAIKQVRSFLSLSEEEKSKWIAASVRNITGVAVRPPRSVQEELGKDDEALH